MPSGSFTVFQFLPLTHPRNAAAEVISLRGTGVRPVLDLEDSVQCVFDRARNRQIKERARRSLLRIAADLADMGITGEEITVRINDRDSPHYPADIDAIHGCIASGFSPSVLLPKARGRQDLEQCREHLRNRTGRNLLVNPLVESTAGMENLNEILAACDPSEGAAMFGYFDYALDSGHWPLLGPFSRGIWDLARSMIRKARTAGVCYIHTPFPLLDQTTGLLRIKAMLLASCEEPVAMVSLNRAQTELLLRDTNPSQLAFEDARTNTSAASDHAEWVVANYEQPKQRRRSVAIIDGRFIPPHEYLAAKAYLEKATSCQ